MAFLIACPGIWLICFLQWFDRHDQVCKIEPMEALVATTCDALQQALCKVYDLWCDQHGLPHLSADEQDCHGMQAGQVEWLTRFQDAWSFYEHADGEARADLRETAAQ